MRKASVILASRKIVVQSVLILATTGCMYPVLRKEAADHAGSCSGLPPSAVLAGSAYSLKYYRGAFLQRDIVQHYRGRIQQAIVCSGAGREWVNGQQNEGIFVDYEIQAELLVGPRYLISASLTMLSGWLIPGYEEEVYHGKARLYRQGRFVAEFLSNRRMGVHYGVFPFLRGVDGAPNRGKGFRERIREGYRQYFNTNAMVFEDLILDLDYQIGSHMMAATDATAPN